MKGSLYSESWFKVADIRVDLLGSVGIRKQFYRGEPWYVLKDSLNNRYFRITPEAYRFIASLSPEKTVEKTWEELLEVVPEQTPSQDEVVELLTQLHLNNLLYFQNAPKNEFLFERQVENRKKETQGKLSSILWIRIPLWNPDEWLNRAKPLIHAVFSAKGLLVWLAAVLFGIKTAAENFSMIFDTTQAVLAPSNLVFLYLTAAFAKFLHEMGHAMMNKRFGGPVHAMGIMLLVFAPLPYADAASAWFFKRRRHRMLVGAAGIMTDLFLASVATVVWANTGDGLLHGLAFNAMFICSVSSLFFNGNPLLKFDAYYILSDALEIPNLYQRSGNQLKYWAEKYLFGTNPENSPSASAKEAFWLGAYGLGSILYRIFVILAIVLFVADKFFALGFVLAVLFFFAMVLLPLKRFAGYVLFGHETRGNRKRAVAVSLVLGSLVFFVAGLFPFSSYVSAPGIVVAENFAKVYVLTPGTLEKTHAKDGDYVEKGDVLATLSSYELELDERAAAKKLARARTMKQKAMYDSVADLKPLIATERALLDRLRFIEEEKSKLTVIAPFSGYFCAPEIDRLAGVQLGRQAEIGTLIGEGGFMFRGIVSQEQAFDLFGENAPEGRVRLRGEAEKTMELTDILSIPYQREKFPSAALGWMGGGDVPAAAGDLEGKTAAEPFFEIVGKLVLSPREKAPFLAHGRSGVARLSLPSEPIMFQLYKRAKQTLQKRYRL